MNETRFHELERLYERASKPRWPWWWYGVGIVLCVLALILVLCSGPGKARAEDAAPAPAAASAEVCAAMRSEVSLLSGVSMQLGYMRMQIALRLKTMPEPLILETVDTSNIPAVKSRAWAAWGRQITAHMNAILLAFGCATD